MFSTKLGRRDLRRSLSGAKFDAQDDFHVHFAVARPNPRQINEKQKFRSELFAEKKNWHRKIKRPKLFETRFAEVSRQSEPSLTGKRSLKIRETTVSGRTNGMTRR